MAIRLGLEATLVRARPAAKGTKGGAGVKTMDTETMYVTISRPRLCGLILAQKTEGP